VTWASLEEERRFLLDSLRDLEREHEKGEIAERDYQTLREDYTARAAEVLRAIKANEGMAHDPLAVEEEDDYDEVDHGDEGRSRTRHSGSRRLVAWAVIAGIVLVAGASVFALAGGRNPGDPATGSVPETPAERLALAHQLESQGQAVEALKLYDTVLEEDPSNVEALTYRGWLLRLAGLVDDAQVALDRAVSLDPSFPDAHFFRGILLFRDRNNPVAAIPELEAYLASNPAPETRQAVQEVLNQARQAAAGPASTTASTTTAPG
jgi:tetratricopeptide (TPR) repeat protein